jgi:Glycosyl hydrolases family 43
MHDPSVIKVGSCYYGFSTGFEHDSLNPSGSITERRTCSGTAASGWTKIGNIWCSTPSWITTKLGQNPPNIWAPDLKYFNNKFYLYYGASSWGSSHAVMGLATATSIELRQLHEQRRASRAVDLQRRCASTVDEDGDDRRVRHLHQCQQWTVPGGVRGAHLQRGVPERGPRCGSVSRERLQACQEPKTEP